MMDSKDIKEIIIALIQEQAFRIGGTNEECAIEVAKFEKAYLNQISSYEEKFDITIDTDDIIM